MNILGKFLLDFKSEEQKQKRVEELSSTLVELSATKDYLVDTYNTLNKSIVTDNGDLENKRVEFNKGYLKQMAQFKLKERKLNEEKDYIEKSIDKTNLEAFSQRNDEEIYKSLDKIKTFYKRSKIDLNTYNDILKSITKKKTHYADICVLNEVGELLLLKRSNYDSTNAGAWVIPGGHVDPGEDCETAAKRELLEEAGISVDLLMVDDNPFKPTWSKVGEYDDENCHIDYFCLSGANMSRFEIILQEEEMRDYCWINRMDIDNYPMVFNMQENVKRVLYWEDTPQTKIIKKAYKTNNMNSLSEKEVSEIRKEKVDLLIKSFEGDILSKDLFMKALKNLGHLVPKKVQIKGKDGKIHQAIRWINPDTGESEKLAEKDKISYTGNFDEDFYSVLNSDSNKASKLRSFVNLGVLDKSILTVLTGVPYSDVNWYLTKGDIQIDLNSLKDNSEIVRDKIRSEQATLDTPEGIENAEITKESRDLDSLWEDYEKNLNRVIKRRHKFAIAYGTGGVGKTYTFDQLANKHQLREYEEEVQPDEDQYDYVVVGGKITPTQVYAELYRHRTKLIVFDDCDSFLKMEEVQGFLKKGLDTGSGCKISNKTSRKVYTIEGDPESGVIPSTFTFSGRVIAITNLTAQQIDQAVKSRGLCSNLSMTVDETIDKLGKIKDKIVLYTSDKAEVIDVSQKARDFAFEILKKNKDKLGSDINTRIYSNSILMADEGIEDGLSEKRIQTEIENYFDSITGNFDESIRKFKK